MASSNMSYALAAHIVLGTYWFSIRWNHQVCEWEVWSGHILVIRFGGSSREVSERVSLNKFHFMHEYRGISV